MRRLARRFSPLARDDAGFAITTGIVIFGLLSATIVGGSATVAAVQNKQDLDAAAQQMRQGAEIIEEHLEGDGSPKAKALLDDARQMKDFAARQELNAFLDAGDAVASNVVDAASSQLSGAPATAMDAYSSWGLGRTVGHNLQDAPADPDVAWLLDNVTFTKNLDTPAEEIVARTKMRTVLTKLREEYPDAPSERLRELAAATVEDVENDDDLAEQTAGRDGRTDGTGPFVARVDEGLEKAGATGELGPASDTMVVGDGDVEKLQADEKPVAVAHLVRESGADPAVLSIEAGELVATFPLTAPGETVPVEDDLTVEPPAADMSGTYVGDIAYSVQAPGVGSASADIRIEFTVAADGSVAGFIAYDGDIPIQGGANAHYTASGDFTGAVDQAGNLNAAGTGTSGISLSYGGVVGGSTSVSWGFTIEGVHEGDYFDCVYMAEGGEYPFDAVKQ